MSLYPTYSNDTAGNQQKLKDRLIKNLDSAIDIAKMQKQSNYNLIFNNSDGLTPQQALDALGTDAAAFLAISAKITQAIQLADTGYVPPALPTLTVNQDGTVTVGA